MARDISTIYGEIILEKDKRLELQEQNSDSRVSIYNGWAYIVAVAIHSFEAILDIFKSDIEEIVSSKISGTASYYVAKAYEFQDGDDLVVSDDGLSFGYEIIDTTKRIVTRASYEETTVSGLNLDKQLVIKVAKGEAGALSPLTQEEKIRFSTYLNDLKFAGTNILAVSKIGDVLIPRLTVFHNGVMDDSVILENVSQAITEFSKELTFDSSFYVSKLFAAIMAVPNVTDVFNDPSATPTQGVFIRSYDDGGTIQPEVEVERVAILESGYVRESTTADQEVTTPNFAGALVIKSE